MDRSFVFRCVLVGLLLAPLPAAVEMPEDVSLVQLIATPERYNGRIINVIGYLSLDREGSTLYLHAEDCDHSLLSNAVSVHPPQAMLRDTEKLSGRYVLIVGVFRAGEKRSLQSRLSGGITQISEWRVWTMGRAGADPR